MSWKLAGVVMVGMLSACGESLQTDDRAERSSDFRGFVEILDKRVRNANAEFLIERMITEHVVCRPLDIALNNEVGSRYECEEVGKEYDGFNYDSWGSGCCPLLPKEQVADMLREGFATAREDASDQYGGGAHRVYALNDNGDGSFVAIITAILPGAGAYQGEDRRGALGTSWEFQDGRWTLTRIVAGDEEFLRPSEVVRLMLYPEWERYEP